jgi:protein-disulfide isomerase
VASRKEQKEAARRQREQLHAQLKASQQKRVRVWVLGGVLAGAIVVAAVFVIASSKSGAGSKSGFNGLSGATFHFKTKAEAKADATSLLKGIPQTGNVLGNPDAPITITEFGDLVCSTCDDFALTSEAQLITADVATGKVKLVYRADDTASSYANASEFAATQIAARSAGLQHLEWDYILLDYSEQPISVHGKAEELAPYISTGYIQDLAKQIPGLDFAQWQQGLTDPALAQDVTADVNAANNLAPNGTPAIYVKGPKGNVLYDQNNELSAVPTLAQLQALIAQVS